MQDCILDAQKHAEKIWEDIHPSNIVKIRKKPTKKKVFEFHIKNIGVPIINILVNGRFYKTIIKAEESWKEL
jgi:hypothetical protein